MEFAQMLNRLWRLRLLVALGVLVAAGAAVLANGRAADDTRVFGAAHTVVYVDSPRPSLVTGSGNFQTLNARAQLLARFVDTADVKAFAARRLGIGVDDITVEGPFPDQAGSSQTQPVAQQRANQVLSQGNRYSALVDTELNVPTIAFFVQAPDGRTAIRFADALAAGLADYVTRLTSEARSAELDRARDQIDALQDRRDDRLSAAERRQERNALLDRGAVVRTLGAATGGDVTDESGRLIVGLVFVAVVAGWCVLILVGAGVATALRRRPARV
jgi:hypothetical protein